MRRNGTFMALMILALTLSMGRAASASPAKDSGTETASPAATEEEVATPRETQESKKHGSCTQLCLADGEDPLDCESYCIQVAEVLPTGCTVAAK
jgi:hypothetical protein